MKNKLIILLIVFLLMSFGYEEVNADIINNYDDINVVAEDIEGINGDIEGKIVTDTINCENFGIGNKVEEGTAIYLTDDENSKNVNTNFDSLEEQGKVETNVDNFPKEIKEVKENLKEYQQQLSDKQLDWKNQKILIDDNGKSYINGTKYSTFITNIDCNEFNKINDLQFEISDNSNIKVVINISGKGDVYFDFNSKIGFGDKTKTLNENPKCKNIIYNILEAKNIYAKNSIYGTILGMNSNFISDGSGYIEGDLYCKNVKLNGYDVRSGYSFSGLGFIDKNSKPTVIIEEYEEELYEGKVKIDGNTTIIENDDGDNTIEVNNKGRHNNESEIHSDNDIEYTKITIEKNKDGKIEKSVISVNDKNEMSIVSNSSDNILVQDNKIEINDSLELKYKDKSGDFISNCDNTSKAIIIGSVALIMCSLLGIYIIKHKKEIR